MHRKKAIYATPPVSVLFKGERYVLADKNEDDDDSEEMDDGVIEEEKSKGTGAARVRINHCKGNGVTFHIEAIIHAYDGVNIPGLTDTDPPLSGRSFRIRSINKLADIPKETLAQINDEDNGEAVIKRLERYLKVKPSPPLYYLSAVGGWNWSKRNGGKEVAVIQSLLEYIRGRSATIYSYCHNKVDMGGHDGLL